MATIFLQEFRHIFFICTNHHTVMKKNLSGVNQKFKSRQIKRLNRGAAQFWNKILD